MPNSDITDRSKKSILEAGSITSFGFIMSQAIRLAGNLILTRLLVPEMFGVMAVASMIMTGFGMLSDTGMKQYVFFSKEGLNKNVLNTAWTMKVIRGFLICILMLALSTGFYLSGQSGLLGSDSTYSHPSLPIVLAGLALCPIFAGFESTKRFELNRRLAMGYIVVVDVCCQLIGLAVMVLLAWIYASIWALVVGNIISSLLRMIATHVFFPGQSNSFYWEREQFEKIFSFSRWILISSILGYLLNHSDWLWLGAFVTAEKLGIYSIGKNLAFMTYGLMNRLSISVVLPELSHAAREDRINLSKTYYRMRKYIDIPAFLISGFLFVAGPSIVEFLYDERYSEAGVVVSILSLLLLAVGFMQAERCLVALGMVKQRAMITGVSALILNITIPIFYLVFGFTGVLYAMLLGKIVPVIILNSYMLKNGVLNILAEIRFTPLFILGMIIGDVFSKLLVVDS